MATQARASCPLIDQLRVRKNGCDERLFLCKLLPEPVRCQGKNIQMVLPGHERKAYVNFYALLSADPFVYDKQVDVAVRSGRPPRLAAKQPSKPGLAFLQCVVQSLTLAGAKPATHRAAP